MATPSTPPRPAPSAPNRRPASPPLRAHPSVRARPAGARPAHAVIPPLVALAALALGAAVGGHDAPAAPWVDAAAPRALRAAPAIPPAPAAVAGLAAPEAAPLVAPDARKILLLRVYFQNYANASRYSKAEVEAHMASMNTLWQQTSYDQTEMDYTVSALFQVAGDDDDYVDWSTSFSSAAQMQQLLTDAVAAAPAGTDFADLDGLVVLMAETDDSNWHRGRAGTYTVPIGTDGADVSLKCAIFVENPSDADVKVWGRWMHEIGHVFQVAGPAHPSKYNSNFELMDAAYPGQTGVFEKLATMGFPNWLPGYKYVAFTPDATVGPAAAGVGGGLASLWATEYDPAGKPNAQGLQAFVTDSVYYLVSMRRRVLGDDLNSSFTPPGIPDEGVLIERVVEGGDPGQDDQWVTLQPPPGGDIDDLWQCGDVYTNQGDGIEIAVGREVVRELVLGATHDAWVRQGDNANHGSETELYVGNFANPEGGFDGRFRSLVRFDLAALPPGVTIESATLQLRHKAVSGSQQVSVVALPLEATWSESTVTWANQPAAAAISPSITPVGTTAGPVTWDVTTQVKSWQAGAANHGLLLRAVDENANVIPRLFFSSEYLALGLGGQSSFKPQLRIVYSQVCPPEDDDPDQSYVRVSYDPGASQPDVHISPWRVAPLDAWESTDIWVDSPVNGYGTYRAGTWQGPWGDWVPYWNGDEPTVGSPNRLVARVRNVGTQNATNVKVHFDLTDPPGLGISGSDGFKALGTVGPADFPGLALIPPGGHTDVWVIYQPEVDLDAQAIEDGFFSFHTCFRVRVDPVAGETILGNQDGEEEQENVFWYEVPVDDGGGGAPAAPFAGAIHLRNPDQGAAREFTLYQEGELPDGWVATVNGGASVLTLGPAAEADVPVTLAPPDPLPAVASAARLDVAAAYVSILKNATLSGPHREHVENTDLGGVSVVGGVVADTDTHCTAERTPSGIAVSGVVSAALGEPLRRTKVMVRGARPEHFTLAAVAPDGTFTAVLEDPTGATDRVDCLFGGTRRLGRSADADVPVPGAPGRATPTADPPLGLAIRPERATLGVGDQMTDVIVYAAPPSPLPDRIELVLTFDPAVLRVRDADPRAPGVQALPGGALAGFAVTRNEADNRAGTLTLAAAASAPPSGRTLDLLAVGLEAVAPGTSPLALARVTLQSGGRALTPALRRAAVTVTDDAARLPFRVAGGIALDGARSHEGVAVCAPAACVATDAAGVYVLAGVRVGEVMTATHPGFLSARWVVDRAPRQIGGPLAWPDVTLIPGDVDGDGAVGLTDGVGVLGALGTRRADGRFLAARDLTRDGLINDEDTARVAAHWGARGAPPEGGAVARGAWAPDGALMDTRPAGPGARLVALLRRIAGAFSGRAAPLARAAPAEEEVAAALLQGASVHVAPARASVAAGEAVTVEIRVDDVTRLYGYELVLSYDPALLVARDADAALPGAQVEVGDFLPAADRHVLRNLVDARAGRVELAAARSGAVRGVAGAGLLARLVFDARAPGGTDLRLLSVALRDDGYPDSGTIAAAVRHGTIDVRPAPSATPPDATPTAEGSPPPDPTTPPAPSATPDMPATASATPIVTATTGTPGAPPTATATAPPPTTAPPTATAPPGAEPGRLWLPWGYRPR